jgi:hypothetical protein
LPFTVVVPVAAVGTGFAVEFATVTGVVFCVDVETDKLCAEAVAQLKHRSTKLDTNRN